MTLKELFRNIFGKPLINCEDCSWWLLKRQLCFFELDRKSIHSCEYYKGVV